MTLRVPETRPMPWLKVRIAELLVERGAMPPVITRSTVVGPGRSQALFDAAHREHAQRLARAIIHRHDAGDREGGVNDH